MSFTLGLGARDGTQLKRARLSEWAATRRNFSEDFGNYHNESTGVYFTLRLEAGALSVDINYNRPTFFGSEAVEVLGALISELELVVSNPQVGASAAAFDGEAVLASYIAGNSAAVKALTAVNAQRPAVMSRANAMAFWRYRQLKGRLEAELSDELGESYMVPDLLVVAHGGRALRVAFLPQPTYYVLPPTELLLFKRGEATCVAHTADILQRIGSLFVPMTNHPELRMSTESALFDSMDEWDAALDSVALACPPAELKRLASDAFVDE